jgi:hypothetical protein
MTHCNNCRQQSKQSETFLAPGNVLPFCGWLWGRGYGKVAGRGRNSGVLRAHSEDQPDLFFTAFSFSDSESTVLKNLLTVLVYKGVSGIASLISFGKQMRLCGNGRREGWPLCSRLICKLRATSITFFFYRIPCIHGT